MQPRLHSYVQTFRHVHDFLRFLFFLSPEKKNREKRRKENKIHCSKASEICRETSFALIPKLLNVSQFRVYATVKQGVENSIPYIGGLSGSRHSTIGARKQNVYNVRRHRLGPTVNARHKRHSSAWRPLRRVCITLYFLYNAFQFSRVVSE